MTTDWVGFSPNESSIVYILPARNSGELLAATQDVWATDLDRNPWCAMFSVYLQNVKQSSAVSIDIQHTLGSTNCPGGRKKYITRCKISFTILDRERKALHFVDNKLWRMQWVQTDRTFYIYVYSYQWDEVRGRGRLCELVPRHANARSTHWCILISVDSLSASEIGLSQFSGPLRPNVSPSKKPEILLQYMR